MHVLSLIVSARNVLTAGSLAVVVEVALLLLHSYSRLLHHLVDLGHTQFGVHAEEEASGLNGQVVLGPVPQVLHIHVVDGRKRIHTENGNEHRK